MKRVFLYIDESKDYKNNLLYMGGLFGDYGLHAMNTHCKGILETPYELSSTRKPDRDRYIDAKMRKEIKFSSYCKRMEGISSDRQYLDGLKIYLQGFIETYNPDEIIIFADSLRLDSDMRRIERIFSKALSSYFLKTIKIEFLNSSNHLSIQFADMEIGLFRRCEQ